MKKTYRNNLLAATCKPQHLKDNLQTVSVKRQDYKSCLSHLTLFTPHSIYTNNVAVKINSQ